MKEGNFLRQLILKETQELAAAEVKISDIKKEKEDHKRVLKAHESTLQLVQQLHASARSTLASFTAPMVVTMLKRNHIISSNAQETNPAWTSLEEKRVELVKAAESMEREASQRIRDAERDIDSSKSTVYFLNQSLIDLLEIQAKTEHRLLQIRDITSSRRRMPDELWTLIFKERVMEDELPYTSSHISKPPPFTTLRLTWVCRLWRTIIEEQPLLWRYIAIPFSRYLSVAQLERIKYFMRRIRNIPPYVYVVCPQRNGKSKTSLRERYESPMNSPSSPESISSTRAQGNASDCSDSGDRKKPPTTYTVAKILTKIPSFSRLKLYVVARWNVLFEIPDTFQPSIQHLVLVTNYGDLEGFDVPVEMYPFFKNVKSLRANYVQMQSLEWSMNSKYYGMPCLETVHIKVSSVSRASVSVILDGSPNLKSLRIEHVPAIHSSTINHGLTEVRDLQGAFVSIASISCSTDNLFALFTSNVHLPNLRQVTILQALTSSREASNAQAIVKWNRFLSVGQRSLTITTLGLSAHYYPALVLKTFGRCLQFIVALPNVNHLILEDSLVVPALEELSSGIPEGISKVTISKCYQITEEKLNTFITRAYKIKRGIISFHIADCPSISEAWKRDLPLFLEALETQRSRENIVPN